MHFVSDILDIGGVPVLGGSSLYELDGGELNVGSVVVVGIFGPGVVTQTGGLLSTQLIDIGSDGTFTWSGGSLSISTLSLSGRMALSAGARLVLRAKSVQIHNATGQLDLGDNQMIIDYEGASAGTVMDQLRADLRDGALFSSSGSAAHRLGYADDALLGEALVKYTYTGDANLDAQVDITDLEALAAHWQSAGFWTEGDFDYTGFVNIDDLQLLAYNWQAGVQNPLPPESLQEALESLGLPVVLPEPAYISGAALLPMVLRRLNCRLARRRASVA
ncbi:hypothetical protein [Fontivita pretiosa]|uniref:hypothetical protein n=1 Tax=Fontivita pretiosa TaxID=2989684 RepID=UPI003D185DCF